MEGYDSTTYGQRFADVYDHWYQHISDVEGTVAAVTNAAQAGAERRVLELGVGTGRLALPISAAGGSVVGLDSSVAMLDLLRAKPGAETVELVLGDMAEIETALAGHEPFDVVLVAFNTFFNLTSEEEQLRCLRGISAVLAPHGSVFIETFVPQPDAPVAAVSPTRVTADKVVLTATRVDHDNQTISGQHIDITEAGTRLRPWFIRYATPDQLDRAAASVSLELVERHGGWRSEPFDDTSTLQLARYRHRQA